MAKVRSDKGWLFLDFRHRRERSREYLNLPDTRDGRRAAENIKRQVEAELRAGTFDATRRFPNSAKLHSHGTAALTLAEFACQWMEEWGLHLKPSTRDWYRGMLTAYVFSDPLASKPIAEIGERDVYALLKDLAERPTRSGKPLSARSVNAVRAGLHTIFGVARRRKLIADDPTAYVAKLREEKPEVDPFDHEEVRALLDAAIGWERCFLAVLLFAGLRPNEAFALRWDDLDWQHGQILVRRTATRFGVGSPKTKSSNRDVPMILRLRELLAEQRQRSALRGELVFPDANGAIFNLANFRHRNWARILRHSRVRRRPLYQCRHTFVRLLLEGGEKDLQRVARALGHSTVRMIFEVYGRWSAAAAEHGGAFSTLDAAARGVCPPSAQIGGKAREASGGSGEPTSTRGGVR